MNFKELKLITNLKRIIDHKSCEKKRKEINAAAIIKI